MEFIMFCLCVVCFVFMFSECACVEFNNVFTVNMFDSSDSLPTPDLIIQDGYKCETHRIVTEDGFILSVHRIPGNMSHGINQDLPPIILQHGLLDSSADWVIGGPKNALAFLLADKGYDVWLGNARGNIYSRAHTKLDPEEDSFWNWSWHEMGYYDLPALVDYIVDETKHEKLQYIGHSMGTTMFFVMASTRPEYNDRISYMVALAPVAFMSNTKSPVRLLVPFANSFEKVIEFFGHGELALNKFSKFLLKAACLESTILEKICENILFLFAGFDSEELNLQLLPLILGHNPAGTSSRTVVHYGQEIKSEKFCEYDHGEEKNLVVYNSTTPPEYNFSAITVPMSLHYADNDLLATSADVKNLYAHLQGKVKLFKVNYEKFNHLDFLWGRDVKTLVYDKVIELLSTKNTVSRRKQFSLIDPLKKLLIPDDDSLQNLKVEDENKMDEMFISKLDKTKTAEVNEPKVETSLSNSLLAGIQEKIPGWQATVVEKLVSLQQLLKRLTS